MTLKEFESALKKAPRIWAYTQGGGAVQVANPKLAIEWLDVCKMTGTKPRVECREGCYMWIASEYTGEEITP